MKSTSKCEVVDFKMEKHPGADLLSLVNIFGYTYVAKTEDWATVSKAIYICPDSLVDVSRPEFSFFASEKRLYDIEGKQYYRIKAKKIRGVVSFGFCVPAPDDAIIGEDWAEKLGVIHFDEDVHSGKSKGANLTGGEVESPPDCYFVKYDVDSLRRYKEYFTEGELVYISEKLHGASCRICINNDNIYVGSRNEWKREYASPPNYDEIENRIRESNLTRTEGKLSDEELDKKILEIRNKVRTPIQNAWWKGFRQISGIEKFCRDNPNTILYGELVGTQGGFSYGCKSGEVAFYAFDILKDGNWLNPDDFLCQCEKYEIPTVPILKFNQPYSFEQCCELAEGQSLLAGHVREGVVIKPVVERTGKIGRVCLKLVGAGYLEKA